MESAKRQRRVWILEKGPFVEYLLVPEAFTLASFDGDPYFIVATTRPSATD